MHLMIVLKTLIKSSWSIQNLSPQNTTFWYIIDFFELKELKKTIDVQSKAFSKSDMSFSLVEILPKQLTCHGSPIWEILPNQLE